MATRWEQEGPSSGPVVSGFSGRGFKVDGQVYDGVILRPTGARAWNAPPIAALTVHDLGDLPAMAPLPAYWPMGFTWERGCLRMQRRRVVCCSGQ